MLVTSQWPGLTSSAVHCSVELSLHKVAGPSQLLLPNKTKQNALKEQNQEENWGGERGGGGGGGIEVWDVLFSLLMKH